MVVHTLSTVSAQKAEVGQSLSFKPTWSTEPVLGQPGLNRETLSQGGGRKKMVHSEGSSLVSAIPAAI